MHLTTYTDYCLRVLMYAGTKKKSLCTIDELAAKYQISRNHLMKVVFQLGKMGYLVNIRGKGGGIKLARKADKINLGDLIRKTEENMELVDCFREKGVCPIDSVCVLRRILNEALSEFLAVLDQYTLADLLAPRQRLSRLLGIPVSAQSV